MNRNRELVLLLKTGQMNEKALEKELNSLELLLHHIESPDFFCKTHELVERNCITSKEAKLINSYYQQELKPFWFLINKN